MHYSSLILKMSMFTLAISCLTTSNVPWFMDLALQVPVQYCSYSIGLYFHHQSHPLLGIVFALRIGVWLFLLSAVLVVFFHWWLSPDEATVFQIMLRVFPSCHTSHSLLLLGILQDQLISHLLWEGFPIHEHSFGSFLLLTAYGACNLNVSFVLYP